MEIKLTFLEELGNEYQRRTGRYKQEEQLNQEHVQWNVCQHQPDKK